MKFIKSIISKIDITLFVIYGFLGFGSMYLASFIRSVTKLNFWAELLICFLIISPIYFLVRVLKKKILKLMLRILVISLFLVGTILIFSYLTTYLVKKFGRLIAISSIISVGIILSAIIIAHEDGCVTEVEGLEAAKVCWFK